MSTITEDDQKSFSLKKRWLAAHHHDDQIQVNNSNEDLSKINHLIRKYNFQDWQAITVLVQSNPNEYISGKIVSIGSNGCLSVQSNISSDDEILHINVYENMFGILSDNAPSIRDLVEGKLVLCKNQKDYQTAVIIDKTTEGKFQILFKDQNEILSVPRQSIRLFLPPWHDGLFFFIFWN